MRCRHTSLLAFTVAVSGLFAATGTVLAQELTAAPGVVRYDGHKVVRANIKDLRELEIMQSISPDCWSHGSGIGQVDYRIPPDRMEALIASGIEYEVLIDDVQALDDAQRLGGQGDGWYDSYHDLAAIEAYMQSTHNAYPDLTDLFVVGNSLEGRAIHGIKIHNPNGGEGNPDVVYHGGIHAREWITTMACTYIMDTLLSSYGTDPDLTALVDQLNFHIIPVMNVDGYSYTWTNNRLWRKNRRHNSNGTWGVDLNRNYSVGWGGPGSSGSGSSETYRGTAAFSEPESQAMRDYQLALPNFQGFIDIHSYSQLILQPYGWTPNLPPDHSTLQMIGANMETAMESLYGKNYTHGNTYDTIYPASGVTLDWAYDVGGAWGMSFELRDTGQFGFELPASQITPASEECFAGAMVLARFLTMQLAVGNLTAGQNGQFDVTGATPNTLTYLAYSVQGLGSFYVAPLNVTLDIAHPVQGGTAKMSNAGGNASWTLPIPGGTNGRHVWFQAAQFGRKSNVVAKTIN